MSWTVVLVLSLSFLTSQTTRFGNLIGVLFRGKRFLWGGHNQVNPTDDDHTDALKKWKMTCQDGVHLELNHLPLLVQAHYRIQISFEDLDTFYRLLNKKNVAQNIPWRMSWWMPSMITVILEEWNLCLVIFMLDSGRPILEFEMKRLIIRWLNESYV